MKTKSLAQVCAGLLVIAVGIGLLLNGLNIINFKDFISQWWPLVPIAIGVIGFISNPRQWVWPLVFIGFGVALLLKQLGVIDVNIWGLVWPSIIILVGLSIIFQGDSWDKPTEITDDHTNAQVIFAGQNARNVSQHYKGGAISAVFGGIDLDLRDAKIVGDAKLSVFAAFGGADIKVPEGWLVKVSGLPVFGGWEDKTKKPADKNAPVLRINATCLFGGFSVQNKAS